MPPPTILSARRMLKGRSFKLILEGRQYLNGERFSETFPIEIEDVDPSITLTELIGEALEGVQPKSDIPIDLLDVVCIRFGPLPPNQSSDKQL